MRIAVGARPGSITTAIGVLAALGLGQLIASQLYGMSARDASTYVAVVAVARGGVGRLLDPGTARRAARSGDRAQERLSG